MSTAAHHVRVLLRLLCTTRGGLVSMLVLTNCVPMVAMSMFVAGGERRFAHGYTLETFVFSLLFAPVARWALGYALGRHSGRTTAAVLPLSPRGRAVAETAAVVLALWIPAAVVTGLAAVAAGMTMGSELREVVVSLATLCGAMSALALPHLILASLDREAGYRHRMWIRWLAAPSLIAVGLAFPPARSLAGYVVVGLGAAALVTAWGPVSWLGIARRRAPLAPAVDPGARTREAPSDPEAALWSDFRRGLGMGATRGAAWAVALVGPLVVFRWWRYPAVAVAVAVVIAAAVAGGFPLGLRARVVGGRWANNGDFGRAWSALPVSKRALDRAVYLHVAGCSVLVLVVTAVALTVVVTGYPAATSVATTGALLAFVLALALVGIRTNAAVGSSFLWQFSWLASACAVACVWLSRFAFDGPRYSMASTALAGLAVAAAFAVAVSPAFAMRAQRGIAPPRTVPGA
ncbi:MAG: hypothetical protein ACRBN8_26865 [Nannocystales bacterium]